VRISVAIPTYNRAHLLGHAIDSVLSQTYPAHEIIVIDDGSTDGTEALVARYGDKVQYYKQRNGGLGVARNAGLDRATGDCMAFLDSDDYWFDFKLELQVQVLERVPTVNFVFSEFEILKDDGRRIPNGSRTWLARDDRWEDVYQQRVSCEHLGIVLPGVSGQTGVYTGPLYRHFMDEALVLPTTALVRRQALSGLRFTEGMTIFEDWEFFARLARDNQGAFIDAATAVNRGHSDPGRLTRCSALAKAQSYLEMFGRVWGDDARFRAEYPQGVCRAESAALIAVARTALLASRKDVARDALRRWRMLDGRKMRCQALACATLARVPGGKHVLRAAVLGEKLMRRIVKGSRYEDCRVNPAA